MPSVDMATPKAHALAYAEAGWAVLPCDGKDPMVRLVPHAVKDATTRASAVAFWWQAHPRANVAIAVPETVIVVDIDPQNGGSLGALEQVAGPMPRTMMCLTGRGGGSVHLYLVAPDGEITGRARMPVGIDIKAFGGYVLAPPSVHPDTGGRYRWQGEAVPVAPMPDALALLLTDTPPATWLGSHTTTDDPFLFPKSPDALLSYVRTLVVGNRNSGLFWAACRAAEEGHPIAGDLVTAAATVGLAEHESRRTVTSAWKRITGQAPTWVRSVERQPA